MKMKVFKLVLRIQTQSSQVRQTPDLRVDLFRQLGIREWKRDLNPDLRQDQIRLEFKDIQQVWKSREIPDRSQIKKCFQRIGTCS